MLFADWALGLTHSIRAIKGHCSTGGKKTCFVGILLHTQSVHTDSQKHTWHTQTPRHPDTPQTPRHQDTQTPRHTDTHTYTITCQLPCCTDKSFKFCQPHFPQNSPYIFHEICCPPGLKGNLHTPVSLWQPFRWSLIE